MLPRLSRIAFGILMLAACCLAQAAPLRVLVVSDDPAAATALAGPLASAGAKVTQASAVDASALTSVDSVLLYGAKFNALAPEGQKALAAFAQHGGGIVAIRGGIASGDAAWGKSVLGGAWTSESQKFRNKMLLTIRTDAHPITLDASTFDIVEETIYDLSLNDNIFVLSSAFTPKVTNTRNKNAKSQEGRASVYDIQPQVWAYEAADHRAVVILPGADIATLSHATIRAFIARGLAWSAKRDDINEFAAKADLATLRYPAGGPLRGDDAIAQFRMQPGFKATVIAAEPLINKPIAQQWDERGRLWVAETPEYPNGRRPLSAEAWKEGGVLQPGNYDRPAHDKISILISSKNNGIFDQKRIFHEGLELITGFCFYKDGVIVVAQEKIVWLRDTKGTGKADTEVILFGGFKPGDTHFVANHFIVAPDGWIYASNGGGAAATRGTTTEVMARITSGTFRFKPDGSAIEQVASQGGNSFGNEVTSDMELFHGKATNGNPIQHVVLPETILAKAPGTNAKAFASVNPGRPVVRADMPDRAPLMQIDQVGRYSSACGSAVYEGGAWPKEYNGTVFMSEPILDIIHHEKMTLNGPAYVGELLLKDAEWLRSMDHWFCPVDMSFGPDGAMYILDFYTPVVAHNDTRGPQHSKSGASVRPDREHYFGRIYRIQHESAPTLVHPDLSKADASGLVSAFRHPSKAVRFNAIRVLMDRDEATQAAAVPLLVKLAEGDAMPESRIQALWALQRLGRLTGAQLAVAAASPEASVRKNAFLVAESGKLTLPLASYQAAFNDADARVRLAALRAIGAAPISAEIGVLLVSSQPKFTDDWSKAAASAAAAANPGAILQAMLASDDVASIDFARSLAAGLAGSGDDASRLAVVQAASSARNLEIAKAVLRELALRKAPAPADRNATVAALGKILGSKDLAASGAALAASWVTGDDLKSELSSAAHALLPMLTDAKADANARAASVQTLVSLRRYDAAIVPAVGALLVKGVADSLGLAVIDALALAGDDASGRALLTGFIKSDGTVRKAAYAALMTRPDWAGLVLGALESKAFSPMQLGPLQSSQLLRHPDADVAKRASAAFAKFNAGTSPAKDDIIAKLRPEVEKPGDIAKGKEIFVAVCSTCHRLGDVGYDFGPNLAGIGSHPVAELLVHIVDPSRMVDDEHRTWNIKLKDGTLYSALIASENTAVLKLKQPAGLIVDVKVGDIASRQRVETSLMPEGFEALGAEGLRNLIAYIRSTGGTNTATVVGRFHLLDLSPVVNADSRLGLYASKEAVTDNLPFAKFGQITTNGVPFTVLNPADFKGGKNILVLKGGAGRAYSQSFVPTVEVPVGLAASRIHMLGAVGGWGGTPGPALTVEIVFLSGRKQTVVLYGGQHFTDYISADANVPGSKLAEGVVKNHQVRTLVIPVEGTEIIDKLILTSAGKEAAPTTVAITVEVGGPANAPGASKAFVPLPVKKAAPAGPDSPQTTLATGQKFSERKSGVLRVLVTGAGSSHHFPKFFLGTDAKLMKEAGYDVAATPNGEEALALLAQADLLVFSGNHKQYSSPEFQKALTDFADAGKGIVILHAGVWYNWGNVPAYNDRFIAGGSRGHGHGDFKFTTTKPDHPVMKGVPGSFIINDESYNVELTRPEGVEVLGTIPRQTPKPGASDILPSVWIVRDAKTRIVCMALGHDEKSHDHPAYKQLLLNSLTWVSQK